MNEIILSNRSMPLLNGCDQCTAQDPFYHADRLLDFHVLIYGMEGTIYVTEDDYDYEINPGELLFLKKGIHHFGKREISKGTRWYFAHFYSDEQPSLPSFFPEINPITPDVPVPFSAVLPKKLTGLWGGDIEQSFFSLINDFYSDDPLKKWNINKKLFELLSLIAFHDKLHQDFSLSDRICEYLNNHLREPFCAASLEQHFFLSYKYMAAVFKKEKNTTMQKYHSQLRIQEACKLLKSTLLPVGMISSRLGYSDMLYFSRCFHQYAGMSPSEYRKTASARY